MLDLLIGLFLGATFLNLEVVSDPEETEDMMKEFEELVDWLGKE